MRVAFTGASFGLGVILLRNVFERRSELALLLAVGFRKSSLKWLVLSEHAALLVTGFPYTVQEKLRELVGLFAAFLDASRAVRRLGSAALDIAYVAAGRMDGFWEQGLNAWDIAAGVLLVQEAGGRVTGLDGGPFELRTGRILATNGLIHDDMRRVVESFYNPRPA